MTTALNPSIYPSYAAECGDPSRTKRLGFGTRPALLFLDVCSAYYSPKSPLCLPSSKLKTTTKTFTSLLSVARSCEKNSREPIPIIFAQTAYTHPKCLDAGLMALKSGHAQLFSIHNPDNLTSLPSEHPTIHPCSDDIILRKKYPSPFFGTNLATQLTALGVDTLIIAGFTTSLNVRAATLDAMQSGFRPMVVMDGCADRGDETHWANLMDLGAKYGDVVSVQDACEALRKGWAE